MSELRRFYDWIGSQIERQGGYRYLADATGASGWPKRGVYFFFDPDYSRIVRVGTHALTFGSRSTTLWGRLRGVSSRTSGKPLPNSSRQVHS